MVTKLSSHGPVATGKDAKNAPSAYGVAVIFSKLLMLSRSFRCLASPPFEALLYPKLGQVCIVAAALVGKSGSVLTPAQFRIERRSGYVLLRGNVLCGRASLP